jgi:hypothetical protein
MVRGLYSRLNDQVRARSSLSCSGRTRTIWSATFSSKKGGRSSPSPRSPKSTNSRVFETPFDRKAFFRVTGAALHPERESLETLKRIRATIGEDNFAGRYQQTPAPAGGGTLMADLVARETGSVCPDWMVADAVPRNQSPVRRNPWHQAFLQGIHQKTVFCAV